MIYYKTGSITGGHESIHFIEGGRGIGEREIDGS